MGVGDLLGVAQGRRVRIHTGFSVERLERLLVAAGASVLPYFSPTARYVSAKRLLLGKRIGGQERMD